MTTSILLMFSAMLPGGEAELDSTRFDHALSSPEGWVASVETTQTIYRGQSPAEAAPLTVPPQGIQSYYQPDPYAQGQFPQGQFPQGQVVQPYQGYPAPITQDPWLGGGAAPPMAIPAPGFGSMNAQPHRFGWQTKYDMWYAPGEGASGNGAAGNLETFGIDLEEIWTSPVGYGWIYSMAPQFNYRSLSGPVKSPTTDLPGSFYRFGLDLELQTPNVGGWTWELGFTPGIATDLKGSLNSDAYQFDGRIIAFWQVAPQWTWALGIEYWDRVDDKIIPHVGAIWNPNPLWEFRLIFPRPRVQVFLGTPWGVPTWLYAEGEYNVESYAYNPPGVAGSVKTQFEDWRVVGGLRWETGYVTTFAEAGWIFDRKVQFEAPLTRFGVNDGFITRVGIRF